MVKHLAAKIKTGYAKQPAKKNNLTIQKKSNLKYTSAHCVSSRAQGTVKMNSFRLTKPLPVTNDFTLTLLRPEKDMPDSNSLLHLPLL